MANYSDEVTDKSLKRLEKQIAKEYASAYEDMKEKADAYFNTLDNVRYQKEHEAYLNGVYTKQQFDAWYATQVQRGKGYEKMRDDLAYRMVNANQVASAYVNDKTPGIYALNYNYSAYEISQAYGVSFDIYDEQTVKRLITGDNAIEFRTLKVNPVRDYEWNREQINSALLNGILTGKDLNELSSSFLTVMKRNENSAIRNARTAYTSAQNGGRMQSYKKAEAMGIKMEKEWLATLDSRTRDSHQALDGVRIKVDELFDNGLEYPGDPGGAPEEVYNCRCTVKSILPDVNDEKRKTYSDWINEQRSDQNMKKKYQSDEQKKLQDILNKWDIRNGMYNDIINALNNNIDYSQISQRVADFVSEKDVEKQMEMIKDFVGEYLPNNECKWNGKIKIKNDLCSYGSYDPKTTNIYLRDDATIKSKIHEMIHAYAIRDIKKGELRYVECKMAEEGAVELLAEEICKQHGIPINATYGEQVNGLREIADHLKYPDGNNYYHFAIELMEKSSKQRYNSIVMLHNILR